MMAIQTKNFKEITRNSRKQLYLVGMQEYQNCNLRQQAKVWEDTKHLTQKKKNSKCGTMK